VSGALADTPPRASLASRRLVVSLLGLATLVATALHLPFLSSQSYWFDETYTVHVVDTGSLGTLWDRIGASESTPPLFYLLTWGWTQLAGDGEAAMRTVSALALIAAVPVAYLAFRRLVGVTASLAVAALLAVAPLLGWYALDARAYGLLVLTALLSVWACSAVLERATTGRLALWALAAAATIWTHWFAGFLVLGEVVALLWLRPHARRPTLLASGAVLVVLLPLLPLLHDQTGDGRAEFIADTSLADRVEQFVRQFAAGPNVPRSWLEAASLAVAVAALTAGIWLTARRASGPPDPDAADAQSRDGARALLAIAAVALLVPLALAATGLYDRFNVRNVLFLWPLLAALAAPALLRLRATPLAALLALGVATTLWVQSDWRYENTDWRGAIEQIETTAPNQPVVAVTPLGQPVAALYLDRERGRPPRATAAPLTTRRAWLVVEPTRTAGSRALQPTDPPVVATLLASFPDHREQQLHGFRLIDLRAPTPVALDTAALPGSALLGPPQVDPSGR
jgi:hypothetical protein